MIRIARKEAIAEITEHVRQNLENSVNRDKYICGKYNNVLNFWNGTSNFTGHSDLDIRHVILYRFDDCDNALKDTISSMNSTKYAMGLWYPVAFTMDIRVALIHDMKRIAKLINFNINDEQLWLNDLQASIRDYFGKFLFHGGQSIAKLDKNAFTDIHDEACKMGSKLIYLLPELYPDGVPWRNSYNTSNVGKYKHLQYLQLKYPSGTNVRNSLASCIFGGNRLYGTAAPNVDYYSMDINIAKSATYTVRVNYLYRNQYAGLEDQIEKILKKITLSKNGGSNILEFRDKPRVLSEFKMPLIYDKKGDGKYSFRKEECYQSKVERTPLQYCLYPDRSTYETNLIIKEIADAKLDEGSYRLVWEEYSDMFDIYKDKNNVNFFVNFVGFDLIAK